MNKSDAKTKKFLLVTFLLLVSFLFNGNVKHILAVECEDYACSAIENDDERATCVDKKISCYQSKIDESKSQQNTLNNAIANINWQVKLNETEMEKTRFNIILTKKNIEAASERINLLEKGKEEVVLLLVKIVPITWKTSHLSDLEIFLSSENFNDALEKQNQMELTRKIISKKLFNLQFNIQELEQMKQKKEDEKNKLEKSIELLKQQQKTLDEKKAEKTILLAQTKNDEKTYQRLIEDARKEADSFRNFAASAGGGSCLSNSPGEGNNGWYFSQRDPRWCRQYVGGSSLTVGEVGCYLTSVTMVHKKYGFSTSPSLIAANRNYFFSNTALMLTPPAPNGYTYKRYDYFKTDIIDNELSAGRPVIVHVRLNNGYGGHFVVLFSGSGGSYTMHDPWYGADLNFSSHYSTGMIDSLRVFTK